MHPESLLKFSIARGKVIPHYLDEADHPWLRLLWQEYLRFVGRPREDLLSHLATQLPFAAPAGKRRMVSHALSRIFKTKVASTVPPRELRSRLFVAAAESSLSRVELRERVAGEFGIHVEDLERSLYADLPNQRCLVAPKHELPPNELALRTNLMLIQGLLARARAVEIVLCGNSAAVVRHAKRKGLICVVKKGPPGHDARLLVSGPYTLFRSTLIYGRALGELVPVLAWCHRFTLRAEVVLNGRSLELDLQSSDPILPSDPPKPFDSRLEERFCRKFLHATEDWDLIREPEPVEAGGTIIFPDFAVQHRHDPSRRYLLEIVGYWTPEYLRKKLDHLRQADLSNLLLCISDRLNCSNESLPANASLIRFSKQLQPADVLRALNKN